jgi:hypothetical protein
VTNGFAFVPHVPLSWAAIVVEPAVGNRNAARFGKRGNAPMWISFPSVWRKILATDAR